MAKVYLAVAHGPGGFNKLVVVKQISQAFAGDPEFVSMFLDEARLAARLRHPNVVQTNEVGEEAGRYFIAMEYLEGQPLSRVRARLGRHELPLAMHIGVLIDVLAGLHHAHELVDYEGTPLGVVHRDANPDNVFITYDGATKVVDFGIAKARDQMTQTMAGMIKGKVTYMAPEQARGEDQDRRVDIFSVGVMLWEAATGVRMWRGLAQTVILHRLVTRDIPIPRDVNPDIPAPLEAIIRKATAPCRDDRYATAAELQADLEQFLADIGERSCPRELGRRVASHFQQERAAIRGVIQERLPAAQEADLFESSARVESSERSAFVKNVAGKPQKRLRRAALGLGLVALALWGGTAFTVFRKGTAPRPATATQSPVPRPSAAPAFARATLHVSATPPEARIFLDDQPARETPLVAELPVDGTEHGIRVEAPGYETHTERLTLTGSCELRIVLKQEAQKPREEGQADRAQASAKRRRPLDHTNPYER
jgi:serine/threonine-protein kinase